MFKLTIQYVKSDAFVVNPDHYKEIHGDNLTELLSKFLLEIVNLQRNIHLEELAELRIENDDIPF